MGRPIRSAFLNTIGSNYWRAISASVGQSMAQPGKARMDQHEEEIRARAEAVTQLAIEVFGNQEETERWLNAPNKALGGNSPASLCKTEAGAIQVRRVLHAVEWGGSV